MSVYVKRINSCLKCCLFPLLSRGNDNLQFSRVPETVRQTAD
jgi:hypothetical protein